MKVSYQWLQKYFDAELPEPNKIGERLGFQAFELEGIEKVGDDSILDFDVKPNRAHDCLSHRGVAKEISVIFDLPLNMDPLIDPIQETTGSKIFDAQVEDEKLCRRFSASVVDGVTVKESPEWLKTAITSIGQKSINNIVDATNYVMFNLGQPLHAFDRDKMTSKDGKYSIVVRTAKKGEKITVLSGDEHSLHEKNLLITDGNSQKPLGIAGIKGGSEAEIDSNTTNIIIEAANFHPTNIRKSSQYLKLRTDASARFENEPTSELTLFALRDVVALILDIAGGTLEGNFDWNPRIRQPFKVGATEAEAHNFLGMNIKAKDIEDILDRFGFSYEKLKPLDTVLKVAPTLVGTSYEYGAITFLDAPETFDCSSLMQYIFAQGGISIPRNSIDQYLVSEEVKEGNLKPGDLVFSEGDKPHKTAWMPSGVGHVGLFIGDGKMLYASGNDHRGGVVLIDMKEAEEFHGDKARGSRRVVTDNIERYVVTVPFERLDLRTTEDLIEEIGRVYGYDKMPATVLQKEKDPNVSKKFYYEEKIRDILKSESFNEVYSYTFRESGDVKTENALASDKAWLRNSLRGGIIDSLELNQHNADLLGLDQIRVFEFGNIFLKNGEQTSFAIGVRNIKKSKTKEDDTIRDIIEKLSDSLNKKITAKVESGILEINLDDFLKELPDPPSYSQYEAVGPITYKAYSHYPFALRDVSVWVPSTVLSSDVNKVIEDSAGDLLVRQNLFDTYEKDGRISYAFHLVFQSDNKTLSDNEVNDIMTIVTNTLENNEGWMVR